jgi:hypothetical protein
VVLAAGLAPPPVAAAIHGAAVFVLRRSGIVSACREEIGAYGSRVQIPPRHKVVAF